MKKIIILILTMISCEISSAQWTAIDSGSFEAIWLVQPDNGWSFGKTFRHWDGLTWTTVVQDSAFGATTCAFPSQSDGWVFGSQDSVYRYNGSVWTKQYLGFQGTEFCDFFDADNGWALSVSGPPYRYQNGSWTQYPINIYQGSFFSISASGPNSAWIVGRGLDSACILRFDSVQWVIDTMLANVDLKTICFTDQNHGWAGGLNTYTQRSVIYKYDGNGWHLEYTSPVYLGYGVLNIYMFNDHIGLFSDDTYNIYGYNGTSWAFYSQIPHMIRQYSFTDSINGWALGHYIEHPGPIRNYIWSTINGGLGKEEMSLPSSGLNIFPNPTTGKIHLTQTGENKFKCYIYNLLGELVIQKDICKTNDLIDLDNLPKGLYIMKVIDGSVTTQRKIVKE